VAHDAAAIARALGSAPARRAPRGQLREAAVLAPLLALPDGSVELLFILRPQTMPTHPGQIAFPGGSVDPGDADTWATALRETEEELGIPASAVVRAGRLDDLPTITQFHVTPWVGWVPHDQPLSPSAREVDAVIRVPLATLAAPQNHRTMIGRWRGTPHRMHFYLTPQHVIWGATAEMLTNLLALLRTA